MFSSFSFGKVIKTILPGAILAGGLCMLLEWTWQVVAGHSLLRDIPEGWVTPFTATLIPLSLVAGFLLNTFVWLAVNRKVRSRCDGSLRNSVFQRMRERLTALAQSEIGRTFAGRGHTLGNVAWPERISLEYYYLPRISLEKLNYVWESYFSWYEFQINTTFAIALSTPPTVLFLWVELWPAHKDLFTVLAILIVAGSAFLCRTLCKAAVGNMAGYEKNLTLLVAGALAAEDQAAKAAPPAAAGTP